jgi:hypothetical protein
MHHSDGRRNDGTTNSMMSQIYLEAYLTIAVAEGCNTEYSLFGDKSFPASKFPARSMLLDEPNKSNAHPA